MAIAIRCLCGKQLRVADDHAGRKIHCPGCDRSLRVPDGSEPHGAAPPAERAAPAPPARSAALKVLGALVLLAAACGVYWFFLRGENMSESAFLAPDAQALVSVRIADVAQDSTVGKLLRAQGGDSLRDAFAKMGLDAEEVERFTFVGHDVERSLGWAVVTTTKPYDRKAVLARFQDAATYKHAGKSYHIGRLPGGFPSTPTLPGVGEGAAGADAVLGAGGKSGGPATQQVVFFAGPRLLVLANDESSIQAAIDAALRPSPTGALADAAKEVGGPRHVYAAFHLPEATREKLKGDVALMGPQGKPAVPLLDFTGGRMTVDVGADIVFELALTYPDEGKAKEALKVITGLKALLGGLPVASPERKEGRLLTALAEGLDGRRDGAEVSVKLKVPSKLLEAAAAEKPDAGGARP